MSVPVWLPLLWAAMVAPCAYYAGRVDEWRRVLRYLRRYEDEKPVWWLLTGIVADDHRKRPAAATEGTGE